jgi:hypothetical protein
VTDPLTSKDANAGAESPPAGDQGRRLVYAGRRYRSTAAAQEAHRARFPDCDRTDPHTHTEPSIAGLTIQGPGAGEPGGLEWPMTVQVSRASEEHAAAMRLRSWELALERGHVRR